MNKDLERIIEIPEGVEVVVSKNKVTVKGNGKELVREFDKGKVSMAVADGKFVLTAKGATRRESKMIGTIWAHLKNMIKGVGKEFVYELEIANVHFPMNVKAGGDKVTIKSFLGETTLREARIMPNAKVEVKGSQITVTSHDIEAAGQTAANLEKATRLTGRDRRIFQDGIFITKKPYRVI
ncbi:MAG: 50S ribosomal protein L6 [Nanoarchaeota archaeon]|nr:50S ribosomal protein L6 [Nanoarchaeota archaeon]